MRSTLCASTIFGKKKNAIACSYCFPFFRSVCISRCCIDSKCSRDKTTIASRNGGRRRPHTGGHSQAKRASGQRFSICAVGGCTGMSRGLITRGNRVVWSSGPMWTTLCQILQPESKPTILTVPKIWESAASKSTTPKCKHSKFSLTMDHATNRCLSLQWETRAHIAAAAAGLDTMLPNRLIKVPEYHITRRSKKETWSAKYAQWLPTF